jgi:hypothetical protein
MTLNTNWKPGDKGHAEEHNRISIFINLVRSFSRWLHGQTENTLDLFPPADEARVRICFWSKPELIPGNRRPLSIDVHGLNDARDSTQQHVTLYVPDNTGQYIHVLEWHWGEQWDGVCRMDTDLQIRDLLMTDQATGKTVRLQVVNGALKIE